MKGTLNIPKTEEESKASALINQLRLDSQEDDDEVRQMANNQQLNGVSYVMRILEDILVKAPRALQTSSYLLHEMDKKELLEDLTCSCCTVTLGDDPVTLCAEAGVTVSRLNHHILERIEMALYLSKEFFALEDLDYPVDTLRY